MSFRNYCCCYPTFKWNVLPSNLKSNKELLSALYTVKCVSKMKRNEQRTNQQLFCKILSYSSFLCLEFLIYTFLFYHQTVKSIVRDNLNMDFQLASYLWIVIWLSFIPFSDHERDTLTAQKIAGLHLCTSRYSTSSSVTSLSLEVYHKRIVYLKNLRDRLNFCTIQKVG